MIWQEMNDDGKKAVVATLNRLHDELGTLIDQHVLVGNREDIAQQMRDSLFNLSCEIQLTLEPGIGSIVRVVGHPDIPRSASQFNPAVAIRFEDGWRVSGSSTAWTWEQLKELGRTEILREAFGGFGPPKGHLLPRPNGNNFPDDLREMFR